MSESNSPSRYQSVLLLGPTGSGKTPLGETCQQKGLRGRRCLHFDFGENLRRIAGSEIQPSFLTDDDMAVIHHSLATGALLENETFHIARRILENFISQNNLSDGDILLLNGLPRHIGQAEDVDAMLRIDRLIYLECDAEIVCRRIARNSGGDRANRTDDSLDEIKRKMDIFRERTLPLLDHYQDRQILRLPVEETATAGQMHRTLETALPF